MDNRPRIFGIIGNAPDEYTAEALRSLFAHTAIGSGDEVLLLLKPGTKIENIPPGVSIVEHPATAFAEQANVILQKAAERSADLYLFRNDVSVAPGWLDAFNIELPLILIPASNQSHQYRAPGFETAPVMDLRQLQQNDGRAEEIAAFHRSKNQGYASVISSPYFCLKIPHSVYSEVGTFDPALTDELAEADFTLRTYLKGFAVVRALNSWVLYFAQGRSGQTEDAAVFAAKWGQALSDFLILRKEPQRHAEFASLLRENRLSAYFRKLLPAEHEKQEPRFKPRIAALSCMCTHQRWLEYVIKSSYTAIDAFYFLVNEKAWDGSDAKPEEAVSQINGLADPQEKIRVIRGAWSNENDERNAGVAAIEEAGFDYCFLVDTDEVYETSQLQAAIDYICERRFVPSWRVTLFTYWKLTLHRIDPPEPYKPVIFFKLPGPRIIDVRELSERRSEEIPPSVSVCHHLSYAKSDEEVAAKLKMFSHALQVVPGWYERVWKGWDSDPSMTDIHPCWPAAYRRAIKVNPDELPAVLRKNAK